jgi:hypothetical protein
MWVVARLKAISTRRATAMIPMLLYKAAVIQEILPEVQDE